MSLGMKKEVFAFEYISVGRTLPCIWTISTQRNKKNRNFFKCKKWQKLPYNNSGNYVTKLQ